MNYFFLSTRELFVSPPLWIICFSPPLNYSFLTARELFFSLHPLIIFFSLPVNFFPPLVNNFCFLRFFFSLPVNYFFLLSCCPAWIIFYSAPDFCSLPPDFFFTQPLNFFSLPWWMIFFSPLVNNVFLSPVNNFIFLGRWTLPFFWHGENCVLKWYEPIHHPTIIRIVHTYTTYTNRSSDKISVNRAMNCTNFLAWWKFYLEMIWTKKN